MNMTTAMCLLTFMLMTGCSFLEDPPPYRVLNEELDAQALEDAAPRIDFAQRTDDAFVPSQPLPPRPDMMVTPIDAGSPRINDMGGGEPDSSVLAEGVPTCIQECMADVDCSQDSRCEDGVCNSSSSIDLCAEPERCVAALSEWSIPCAAFNDCPRGQGCIRLDGLGRCATLAGVNEGAPDCENPDHEVLVRRDITTNGELNVCGVARAACVDGVCTLACRVDEDCGQNPEYPSCDVASGRCVCGDTTCQTNASVCGEDGRCECADDEDCTENGLDTCLAGRCVCSSDQGCMEGAERPGSYRCINL